MCHGMSLVGKDTQMYPLCIGILWAAFEGAYKLGQPAARGSGICGWQMYTQKTRELDKKIGQN